MRKRVLILGSGGREDAIARKLAGEEHVIYAIPGNGGTKQVGINVPIDLANLTELAEFARNNVQMTIVGPETIENDGIVDWFKHMGLPIFGCPKTAIWLEADKFRGKLFMKEEGIPTASFEVFESYDGAMEYVKLNNLKRAVVKANGLAAGKGVFVCFARKEIEKALHGIMVEREFGAAGDAVLIEKLLRGRELSLLAFFDGYTIKIIPPIQDYKRANDGDKGLNTGGMGAIGPLKWVTKELMEKIEREIVNPTIEGLKRRKIPFAGFIYFGLMVSPDMQNAWLLEYNMRSGDPETQAFLPLLETPLMDIIEACVDGKLRNLDILWKKKYSVCVILASEGYPNKVPDAKKERIVIHGIGAAEKIPGVYIFHSDTERLDDVYTYKRKRVISVTAIGDTPKEARKIAYKAADFIKFEGKWCRRDIGVEESW